MAKAKTGGKSAPKKETVTQKANRLSKELTKTKRELAVSRKEVFKLQSNLDSSKTRCKSLENSVQSATAKLDKSRSFNDSINLDNQSLVKKVERLRSNIREYLNNRSFQVFKKSTDEIMESIDS